MIDATLRRGHRRRAASDRSGRWRTRAALLVAGVSLGGLLAACSSSSSGSPTTQASGSVLLVGTFDGHHGQYSTIQSAVNAAKAGDWILVAPGDYHENDDLTGGAVDPAHGESAGVLIRTPDLHVRGMSRSGVIVDGTKPGAPGSCSANPVDQNLGPAGTGGQAEGRNGIVVWKANGVSIDNLTACNFLGGAGDSGNEIWWNGGADSGKIGMHGYSGSYLTATSTYFGTSNTKADETTAAQYGVFSSNAAGPGSWNQLYASNFNDSGMYVGACQQACDVTIDHAWMEYSALGYSGTNSGGAIVIENSQFDNNKDGLDTNTQINGDAPAPQNGACPNNGTSPITHTHSCWVVMHNDFHDNNNPNVPASGEASNGPTGTGMTLSGGRNDTVMDNNFSNNGAWGFLMLPYPDSSPPQYNQSCSGTGGVESSGLGCVYDPTNDALLHNTFSHNGFYGNDGNADYGLLTFSSGQPGNCFAGNTAPNGSSPPNLETTYPTCGKTTTTSLTSGPLTPQVLCDTGFGACSSSTVYPKATGVVMHPLPSGIPTMPDPCNGVPDNAWCANGKPVGSASG